MKILHIITSLGDGGAEAVLTRMCLNNPEKHIVISLMDEGKYGKTLQQNGVSVHCLYMDSLRLDLKKIFRLYTLIKSIKPPIVQTWMYHADLLGGLAAKLAGVPKIYWGVRHSNLDKDNIKKSTYFIMKICALLSYFIPKKIISCSRNAIYSHIDNGYKKHNFELIQNGYDLDKFHPSESLKMSFQSKRPIIAMVARYDIQKDHKNLIEALSILKNKGLDTKTFLVGTGMTEENQDLLKLIAKYNLDLEEDIILYGRCDDIPALMNTIDLHVLSSLGEAFPNVLAEAMACGTPCVSTDVGDAKEIVSKYGWIVPSKDPVKLAEAINIALTEMKFNPNEWSSRKYNCVKHIRENFELNTMIKKFFLVWSK